MLIYVKIPNIGRNNRPIPNAGPPDAQKKKPEQSTPIMYHTHTHILQERGFFSPKRFHLKHHSNATLMPVRAAQLMPTTLLVRAFRIPQFNKVQESFLSTFLSQFFDDFL